MIGALVSVISLNMTLSLLQAGQVAGTLPITNATATTPIVVTSTAHGVPLGRVAHGVVSQIVGEIEANGLWVLTPLDANTFALSTFDNQGNVVQSVGVNAYVSGGQIQYAFPDFQILLGRRNIAFASAPASPRVVFVPTDGAAWDFKSYGGYGAPAQLPNRRGSAEQQAEKQRPQLATEFTTFEVHVQGSANPPSPDFGDFDATQSLVHVLYAVLFDAITPDRARILHESWPSQSPDAGTQTQRGQHWMGIIQFQQPVVKLPLAFVPIGTSIVMTVEPVNPGSTDPQVIQIFPGSGV